MSEPLIDPDKIIAELHLASDAAVVDRVVEYLRSVLTPDVLHPAGYDHDGYDLYYRIFGEDG